MQTCPHSASFRLSLLAVLTLFLASAAAAQTSAVFAKLLSARSFQAVPISPSAPADPETIRALDNLARLVIKEIPKHSGTVAVFDFQAANNQWLPFGTWLGDQFAQALLRQNTSIALLDRNKLSTDEKTLGFSHDGDGGSGLSKFCSDHDVAIVVIGSYSPAENGLGLGIQVFGEGEVQIKQSVETPRVKLPLSPEVASRLAVSLNSIVPINQVYTGGKGGITFPECKYCPPPGFADRDILKNGEGFVEFSAVILPNGKPSQLNLISNSDAALDGAAEAAVEKWSFSPARDIDGHAVASQTRIRVTFRLF